MNAHAYSDASAPSIAYSDQNVIRNLYHSMHSRLHHVIIIKY